MTGAERVDDVIFRFISAVERPWELKGRVLFRSEKMVLEIEWPGDRPYMVAGEHYEGFFAGVHEGQPGDASVLAKWTPLDDVYVGTWVEDGIQWLFTFRLNDEDTAER